jgi:hypothetical protein
MKDERMIGAVNAAESGPAASEDRKSEDWSWMVGEDPAFYLEESMRRSL